MKSKEIPSREEQIARIEKKLAENPPARAYAALSRTLAILTGQIKPYARNKADQQQEPPQEPEALPTWWNETWVRVFLVESLCGVRPQARWRSELERYWTSLSDEEKQVLEADAKRVSELPRTAEGWQEWDRQHPGRREELLRAAAEETTND